MASSPSRREVLAALGALGCWHRAAAADEAQAPPQPPQPTPPTLQASLVKPGLYLITGGGGNSLLRFSNNGLVLVNGKSPDSYQPLMSQVHRINKLSDMPIRALILTNAEDAQAANSGRFAAAKVAIVVQANALPRLPEAAAALVPFDRDYSLQFGGIEVAVRYFGKARGDADAVVHFADKKLVALGDLYSPNELQAAAMDGGNLAGWSEALGQVLALDFEQAVPNEGPIVGRAEVIEFKRRLDARLAARDQPNQPNFMA